MIIDDIKNRISIIEIAESEGLKLKKYSNRIYKSLCCFHDETKPSLTFDTKKNLFRCYSCQEHGDIINFYAKRHHLSNQEAIKQLASKVGATLNKKDLEKPQKSRDQKKNSQNWTPIEFIRP